MSKKKLNLKFLYDAPVTLTYAILAAVIFIISITLLKDKGSSALFLSPTAAKGTYPFLFKDPLSYFRLVFHILGFTDKTVLISDLIFILLLGPQMEERYGSVVIGVMIFVSALFSGVLTACICANPTQGAGAPVFMLILLYAMMFLSKKKISGTSIAIILLFIFRAVVQENPNGAIGVVITIAGGLCGSLFALLTSPKSRSTGRGAAGEKKPVVEVVETKSSGFGKKGSSNSSGNSGKKNDSSSEETVIGTLKF